MLPGGGRVGALPSERADIGIETGGDEMVSVVALKLSPNASPHWLQNRATRGFAEPQLTQVCNGSNA
jgi:hypothetical protein